jgi:flavin-dependent dehydrogenase
VDQQSLSPYRVAVIGGGPAGLMAAEVMAQGGLTVTVFERMPGRYFACPLIGT